MNTRLPTVAESAAALGPDLAAHARALADDAPDPTPEQIEVLRRVFTCAQPEVNAAA